MQYRLDKKGNKISILGYGCMRFSRNGPSTDLNKAEKEVITAIESGVNYFDTAYVYPGNEEALGTILERNQCREKIYIATKLPHYLIRSIEGVEKYFKEELKRLKTNYIDYYLMHMLTDLDTWEKLKTLGIEEWIEEKLKSGQIRNIGFSYHGNTDMFIKLVDAYPWDFCQIQYNYMDEHSQAGRRGLVYAAKKELPVIIMEPLRGGRLVNLLPESAKKIFKADKKGWTAAEWALRWLWDQPEVTCILSGMNAIEMVEENIRIASEVQIGEFSKEEQQVIDQVKEEIGKLTKVGCTGCGYCMPCPAGVDIPGAFRAYNNMYSENKGSGRSEYLQCTVMRQKPSSASLCIQCGKCEGHCPQQIKIRKELDNARRALETPFYIIARKVIQILKLW